MPPLSSGPINAFLLSPAQGQRDEHLLREPPLPSGPINGTDRLRGTACTRG